MIARIAVEKISHSADELYSYEVPIEYENTISVGKRVLVPFGKGNCIKLGLVIELCASESKEKLKKIMAVPDKISPVSLEEISLIKWMKKHYFCSYFDAAKLMFPPGIKPDVGNIKYKIIKDYGDIENLGDEKILWERILKFGKNTVSLKNILAWKIKNSISMLSLLLSRGLVEKQCENFDKYAKKGIKAVRICRKTEKTSNNFTPKQERVMRYLESIKASGATVKELCYYTGVGESVIRTLVKNNVLSVFEMAKFENESKICEYFESTYVKPQLNIEQEKVFKELFKLYTNGEFKISLLHGVTGSGKTEVLLNLADCVISNGKSVIFMVPEIALTVQFIESFRKRYKDKVVIIHSSLPDRERFVAWEKIKGSDSCIVLGTRSAVFAPVTNLGLIVIDEEHEFTYKSDSNPRFNAKDIAKYRCSQNSAQLILASATPSLESYYNARIGKYNLFSLKKRYGNAVLPSVKIVDMNEQSLNFEANQFSQELIEALKKNLDIGEQSLIFLNRRGYTPFAKCTCCLKIVTCPNCSVSLNYHKDNGRLMCHYCGYSRKFSSVCPECGAEKIYCFGVGTQKVEDYLKEIFPKARILRMDSDSKNLKNSYECELKKFENGEYDILLGTQMISKGFNFPNVTLVGVLSADMYMYTGDFRSYEKAFSLLTQVVGRAGRKNIPGKAIIQTFSPQSELIKFSAKQDYETFFENELMMRKAMLYPPFADICVVGFVSKSELKVSRTSSEFFKIIKEEAIKMKNKIPLRIFPPCAASIKKIAGNYRYRIIIKCRNNSDFLDLMSSSLKCFYLKNIFNDTRIFVDFNPDSTL